MMRIEQSKKVIVHIVHSGWYTGSLFVENWNSANKSIEGTPETGGRTSKLPFQLNRNILVPSIEI